MVCIISLSFTILVRILEMPVSNSNHTTSAHSDELPLGTILKELGISSRFRLSISVIYNRTVGSNV